jgi:hypothetical protein
MLPPTPDLQQKAQKLREQAAQAQAQTPALDGFDIVHIIDGIGQLLSMPSPDVDQIGQQLTGLAETIQNAIPDASDAGELIQPLLEGIGDLLGSLGDVSS